MSLETLIRQAKPKYIHADSEKATTAVLERLQELPKTKSTGMSSIISSLAGMFVGRIKHRARTVGIMTVAAAVLGTCVIGSGFVYPAMANALSHLPILGSLFEQAGDAGLKTAAEQGLITDVNASVTHDGVTFSISELMYDGTRISMVLTRETSDGKNEPLKKWLDKAGDEYIKSLKKGEEGNEVIQIWANGKKLNVTRSMTSDISHHNSSILTVEADIMSTRTHSLNLPDELNLEVIFWDAKIKQSFNLAFPITKTTRNNIVLTSEELKSHDNFNMNIKKLEVTEATMLLEVNLSGKAGQDIEEIGDGLMYDVLNEHGVPATLMSGSGSRGLDNSSYLNNAVFAPFPTLPKLIKVKPYLMRDNEKVYFPELEFTLPINK